MKALNRAKERYGVSSDPLRTERRVELVALGLVALLLLQSVYSVARIATLSLPEPKSLAKGTLRIVKADQWAEVSAEHKQELVERPLFWTSRRPVVPPPPAPVVKKTEVVSSAKAGDLKKVKILGIFAGEDSSGVIAMVNGKKQRIRVQEEALEWTLDSVEQDRAVFSYNGQTQELLLTAGKLPSAGTKKPKEEKEKSKQAKRKSGAKTADSSGIKRMGAPKK